MPDLAGAAGKTGGEIGNWKLKIENWWREGSSII
jgi:hypothetical protein